MDNELNNREEQLFERLLQHLEDGDTGSICDDVELREALRQLHDTECALRCGNSRKVDVEQELQLTLGKLSARNTSGSHHSSRKRMLYGIFGGIGIGIAATLLLLLSIGYFAATP